MANPITIDYPWTIDTDQSSLDRHSSLDDHITLPPLIIVHPSVRPVATSLDNFIAANLIKSGRNYFRCFRTRS